MRPRPLRRARERSAATHASGFVLAPITRETVKASKALVAKKGVRVHVLEGRCGIYIRVRLQSSTRSAEAVIEDVHDNIEVSLSLNGRPVEEHPLLCRTSKCREDSLHALEAWLVELSLPQLISLLDELDADDLAFLREGVEYNVRSPSTGSPSAPGLASGTKARVAGNGVQITPSALQTACPAAPSTMPRVSLAWWISVKAGPRRMSGGGNSTAVRPQTSCTSSTMM